jgi:threonylcarbamoyladenosine tRNA methylthiotransferase MtaB
MIRFSINTLGCKVNLCESDDISRELAGSGFEMVNFCDDPDYCIINTCTVTAESDRKARQLIRRIRKKNTRAKIIVTGCFTGNNSEFLEDTGIDYIINNDRKYNIPKLLSGLANDGNSKGLSCNRTPCSGKISNKGKLTSVLHSRPLMKIQDGCEQSCTYCIVPIVRGRYKSVSVLDIISKIEYIEEIGYEETVLTGIHIGKYGVDIRGKRSGEDEPGVHGLDQLITEILEKTKIKRIRISSLEINEVTAELLEVIKNNINRIAPHLHIPLQSGSNRILKAMARPYDKDYFIQKIKAVRKILPDIAITTDTMVGFPGESNSDFLETETLVRELFFSRLHVFKYSPRPGTIASKLKDQVDSQQKSKRSEKLRKLGGSLRDDFLNNNLGKKLLAVCERQNKESGIFSGTSGEYIKVYFQSKRDFRKMHGKIIQLKSSKRHLDGLWADEIVKTSGK